MAPTLRGPHYIATCSDCGLNLKVGEDQRGSTPSVGCSRCKGRLVQDVAKWYPGDSLLIDRRAVWLTKPRRWDVLVLRNPELPSLFVVKRVIGLPGERVAFEAGDVWIDGSRVCKSLVDQRRMRIPVCDGNPRHTYWRVTAGDWDAQSGVWSVDVQQNAAPVTLWFAPLQGKPVRDDLASNLSVSRQLNAVEDLMFEATVQSIRSAVFTTSINVSGIRVQTTVDTKERQVELLVQGEPSISRKPGTSRKPRISRKIDTIEPGPFTITLSTFDRQALIAIDGETIATAPLPEARNKSSSVQQIELTLSRGTLDLSNPSLYRDIYWQPQAAASGGGRTRWRLDHDCWFVMGDNQAISRDSRHPAWGEAGVPQSLIYGRVIGY